MDSIRNAANSAVNTASGYIYGNQTTEAGTEPVSGQTGAGTVNEPYDKGNETTHSTNPTTATTSSTGPSTTSTESTTTATNPTTSGTTATGGVHDSTASGTTENTTTHGGPGAPGSEQLRTSVTGVQDNSNVASSASLEDQYVTGNKRYRGGKQASYYSPPTDSTTNPSHGSKIGGPDPASGAAPASGQKPAQKQQGGDRPTEEPTGQEKDAVVDDKEKGEDLVKNRDPNDHSGEPMHMHDGSEKKDKDEGDGEHPGQEGGGKHGQSGSGEKWVKTSGLQAEGGDFDAAQAGAGREADRLLEEKGIVKDERGAMVDKEGNPVHPDHIDNKSSSNSASAGQSKGKTFDKIKEKLHIGSGKKL